MRKILDFTGMFVSFLCMIHCAFMPVVLFFLPTYGMAFLETGAGNEAFVHQCLLVVVVLAGVFSVFPGYRFHKNSKPLFFLFIGLGLMVFSAFFAHDTIGHDNEPYVAVIGSLFLIVAHYLNHKYCNHCKEHKHGVLKCCQ